VKKTYVIDNEARVIDYNLLILDIEIANTVCQFDEIQLCDS
jgi:hypothetical protein